MPVNGHNSGGFPAKRVWHLRAAAPGTDSDRQCAGEPSGHGFAVRYPGCRADSGERPAYCQGMVNRDAAEQVE